jgi:aminoglycoside 6'-N-acetyltransferase I
MKIRAAERRDVAELARMRHVLWPESSVDEHAEETIAVLEGRAYGAMPLMLFVAETSDDALVGFVETGLRSFADGCDPAKPVGYIEGWYVGEAWRRRGVGAALIRAAEDWARAQGSVEMASDALIDNEVSHRAHQALGFEVVDRVITFRKKL